MSSRAIRARDGHADADRMHVRNMRHIYCAISYICQTMRIFAMMRIGKYIRMAIPNQSHQSHQGHQSHESHQGHQSHESGHNSIISSYYLRPLSSYLGVRSEKEETFPSDSRDNTRQNVRRPVGNHAVVNSVSQLDLFSKEDDLRAPPTNQTDTRDTLQYHLLRYSTNGTVPCPATLRTTYQYQGTSIFCTEMGLLSLLLIS